MLLGAIGYVLAIVVGQLAFPYFPRRVVVATEDVVGLAALVLAMSLVASAAGVVRALRIPPTLVLAG